MRDVTIEKFSNQEEEDERIYLIKNIFLKFKEVIRELVLGEGLRLDGRSTDQISQSEEVDYLPSTHGSQFFPEEKLKP